jgi:hypothetical protein
MQKKFWLKGMLISLTIGSLAGFAAWGDGCLNATIQRLLVSYAFD